MNSMSIARLFGPLTMSSLRIGEEVLSVVNTYLPPERQLQGNATGFIVEAIINQISENDRAELLLQKIESEEHRDELLHDIQQALHDQHTEVSTEIGQRERTQKPMGLLIVGFVLLALSVGIVMTYVYATTTAHDISTWKFILQVLKILLKPMDAEGE